MMASQAGMRPRGGPPDGVGPSGNGQGGPPGGGQGGPPGGWGGPRQDSSGGPFRAFRSINYTYYWFGSILSITSFFMLMIARGWLVFDLTQSDLWVTVVSAASLFPSLFFSVFGGVIADRFNRKHILLFSEASNFATLIALALLVATGLVEVWHLLVLSFGHGVTFSLSSPARFSMVPSLVPPQHIANATALSSIMFSGGALTGPLAAGFLLAIDPALGVFCRRGAGGFLRTALPPDEARPGAPVGSVDAETGRSLPKHHRGAPSHQAAGNPAGAHHPRVHRDVLRNAVPGSATRLCGRSAGGRPERTWLSRHGRRNRRNDWLPPDSPRSVQ